MLFIAASLLALSLAPPAEAEMPADFLKADSPAWNEWLEEDVNTVWAGFSLKSALATSFGAADLDVGDTKALDMQIKFDASNMTRRAALWHLSQKYGFTIRWAQQGEPRTFMGLSEAKHRERRIGGVTMTVVTQVMRSDYKDYLDLRQRGEIVEEEMLEDMLYYATNVDRDLNFGDVTAHVFELQRYKTTVPPEEVRTEARFTAKVRWTEPIGRREAEVISIGVDPRWLVGIEILSLNRSAERFDKKGYVVLAIHSPVRVFQVGGKETSNKVYEFEISGSMRHGQATYHFAKASERKQPPELPLVQVEAEDS